MGEDSGTSTPVANDVAGALYGEGDGGAIPEDDLNFLAGIKKKKKKKALEDFERELGETGGQEGDIDGAHLDNIDEAELGDDVFASGGEARSGGTNEEPWLGSDRDYTYPEVCFNPLHLSSFWSPIDIFPYALFTAPTPLLCPTTRSEPLPAFFHG